MDINVYQISCECGQGPQLLLTIEKDNTAESDLQIYLSKSQTPYLARLFALYPLCITRLSFTENTKMKAACFRFNKKSSFFFWLAPAESNSNLKKKVKTLHFIPLLACIGIQLKPLPKY